MSAYLFPVAACDARPGWIQKLYFYLFAGDGFPIAKVKPFAQHQLAHFGGIWNRKLSPATDLKAAHQPLDAGVELGIIALCGEAKRYDMPALRQAHIHRSEE